MLREKVAKTKIDGLLHRRNLERHRLALRSAIAALNNLHREDVEAVVIGSLAAGNFMPHSDVDFLIVGSIEPIKRGRIERIIAKAMAGSNIKHDVVYDEDIKQEDRGEFHHVKADASALSRLAKEVEEPRRRDAQSA
jgi:predicted nucleotidyltransferase